MHRDHGALSPAVPSCWVEALAPGGCLGRAASAKRATQRGKTRPHRPSRGQMWPNSVKLRLPLTGKAASYSLAGGLSPAPVTSFPFREAEIPDYIDLVARPDEAPKPSTRASVPSSEDSRALTSRNRA
jgi:hypothetical protein